MKILFYLPAILFLISGLPQMIKLIKTKSSGDISVLMYLITCTAIIIVIIDAYIHNNNSILVSNLASFAITGTNTFLVIKYKKKNSSQLSS
jgi:MtN3 and saliva related transmembrane protein